MILLPQLPECWDNWCTITPGLLLFFQTVTNDSDVKSSIKSIMPSYDAYEPQNSASGLKICSKSMPGTRNLANYPKIVKLWILEDKLQPLKCFTKTV